MAYEVNFGSIRLGASRVAPKKTSSFRVAMLGDFSARANSGKLDTGASLAARKPLKVDCDNLDATLKRLNVKLRLPMGADGAAVEVPVNSIFAVQPEVLYAQQPFTITDSSATQSEHVDSIEIPILARINFPSQSKAHAYLVAGAGFAFITRAKETRANGNENDLKEIDEAASKLKLEGARLPEAVLRMTGL